LCERFAFFSCPDNSMSSLAKPTENVEEAKMNPSQPVPKSLWPRAIIGFYICFIGAVALFIRFALQQDVHLVREDYYAAEMKFQQQLDQLNRAARLGPEVVIEYSPKHRQLGVKLPESHLARNPAGEIRFYRPDNPALDKTYPLKPRPDGKQFVDLGEIANGSWRVELQWRAGGEEFLKTRRIVVFNPPS